ncbi:class I adenylate-forming enzyme family protein [Francisella sp. 19X1-34]|uniref:class I adenylate-forming enzyme family protein n=1 Tax=Francisella sp. 19X1-34 TaxID=3087177 RepID=UPI002E2EAD96|nr:class I adenylate-forming enzyme family protein [Francisella sp. 19X1-34]MED7789585.1 class I adenylate-forming enzyme family protein [Francisella sp. 19X1-34]
MLDKLIPEINVGNDKVAIFSEKKDYYYSDLLKITKVLVNNLSTLGVKKGDRICLYSENCPELIFLYLAIFKLGAIIVPIYESSQINHFLKNSESNLLISKDENFLNKDYIDSNLLSRLEVVYFLDIGFIHNQYMPILIGDSSYSKSNIKDEDIAAIIYTSGSTGLAKGVVHTHRSMYLASKNLTKTIKQDCNSITCISLSLCHVSGLIGQLIATLISNGSMVLLSRFNAEKMIYSISKYKVSHLQMLSTNLTNLVYYIRTSKIPKADFKSLKSVMVGGDSAPVRIQKDFLKLTNCTITQVMGMTESFSYFINLSKKDEKLGSVGLPALGVQIELRDNDGLVINKSDQIGEIFVKTFGNMMGYWRNDKDSRKTLNNGWLCTGDLAYRDHNGYYWFSGKKKQLIEKNNIKIVPQEIENVLLNYSHVRDACVVGIKNKEDKNILCACVVTEKNNTTEKDIREFCQLFLQSEKMPDKILFFERLFYKEGGKFDRNLISAKANQFYQTSL